MSKLFSAVGRNKNNNNDIVISKKIKKDPLVRITNDRDNR